METTNNPKSIELNQIYGENERELIELLLGIQSNPNRKSTLQLALESARFHCGIEKDGRIDNATFTFRQDFIDKVIKGEYRHVISDESDIFTALLSYFICLEQIGTIFYVKNMEDKKDSNRIVKAIKMFAPKELSDDERIALKNLRNSLGHAYGLVNYDKKRDCGTHKYILVFKEDSKDIVIFPDREHSWNGNFLDKKEESSTIIYVFPLIRFIEKIIQKVIEEYNNGNLCIGSCEEIEASFTIKV